jgi:putative sterol carrier protein
MSWKTILFVTSFIPVAVFKIIARTGAANLAQAKVATVVGLVLAIVQLLSSRKINNHTTYLEWAFLGFLAMGTAWVYVLPVEIADLFVKNSTTILYFVLFLTTLLPQLFGFDPFTYAIAMQWQPEAVWKTPQFKTINLHITYVFCGIMLLACLSSLIGEGKPIFSIIIPFILIIGVGIPFSRLYPAHYIKNQPQTKPLNLADFPKTAIELVRKMPGSFNSKAAGDLCAAIQFRLPGVGGGNIFLSIADKQCTSGEGETATPALTIIAPADIWMRMARGEINRAQAFMDGLFKVEGDMDLLMKMSELFSPSGNTYAVVKGENKVTKNLEIQETQKGKTDAVDDMRIVLRDMAAKYDPQANPGLKAVVQFDVTGKQEGYWFLAIENDQCTFNEGRHANPSVTIKTPSEVWLAIANKELDGSQAFMQGKFKTEGNLMLMMQLKNLFVK